MDLYKEILSAALSQGKMEVTFPEWKIDPERVVELTCYQALSRIQEILQHEELTDAECFRKIEEIVSVFEEMGSSCGNRHDFG